MIKRYNIELVSDYWNSYESESGWYVLFEDYEDALLDAQYDLKELQKKYDALVDKLGELYREG